MKTTDLGNDWFANQHDDGSMTIRNCEKGLRIDLPTESVERLRNIIVGQRPMTDTDTFNSTTGNARRAPN